MFSFSKIHYKVQGRSHFFFPLMARVEQIFSRPRVDNVAATLAEEFEKIKGMDLEGKRIAITAGSRGIPNIPEIIRVLGALLKGRGAHPFVVPAMGSHGNATAAGQKQVLKNLGIIEESIGMEICASMDTECIGHVRDRIPIYFDRFALQADGVVVCGRIKPHTDYRGDIESGICKMMAIGLGNHKGASTLHQEGQQNFSWLIPEVATLCLEKARIIFGVGIIDNAYHETAKIAILRPEEIIEKEKTLLREARSLMAKLYFEDIDVLIVDTIGKEISGAGMDPNVIGRTITRSSGFDQIKIKRIVVLGLSQASGGHASGLCLADITTLAVANAVDFAKTYTNSIASSCPEGGHLPMVLNNDRDAIMVAILTSNKISSQEVKAIHIASTLNLGEISVSQALLPQVRANDRCRILSKPSRLKFDEEGHLKPVFTT